MNYEDVVADFARRTQVNLRAVESLRAEGREVFEVTQLINSMLGLLVFPREDFVAKIPKISLELLQTRGWPVPKMRPGFAQAADLAELVRYLRNAISHFNIEFIGDGQKEIRIIRVWNRDRTGTKTWEADLGLNELRGIAERFIDLLLESRTSSPLSNIQMGADAPNGLCNHVAEARGSFATLRAMKTTVRLTFVAIIFSTMFLSSGCQKKAAATNPASESKDELPGSTKPLEAADLVGYDGKRLRKSVDHIKEANEKHNQDIEKMAGSGPDQ